MDFLNTSCPLCKSLLITVKLHLNWGSNADVLSSKFYYVAPDLFKIGSTFAVFRKLAEGEIWRWIQQSLGSDEMVRVKISATREKKGLNRKTWVKVKLELVDTGNGSFWLRGRIFSRFILYKWLCQIQQAAAAPVSSGFIVVMATMICDVLM